MNDIARVSQEPLSPYFMIHIKNRQTGSLIIIDEQTNETIGPAMIISEERLLKWLLLLH